MVTRKAISRPGSLASNRCISKTYARSDPFYSGDLLEDTITALDHAGGAIRFFFNALPTMPEPPNGFASVTSSLLDHNLLFGSGSPATKASTDRRVRSIMSSKSVYSGSAMMRLILHPRSR